MKVPFSWLAEFVELVHGPEATAEMLTSAGMKVEKIHRLGEGLEGVVAGKVLDIEPHPNADKLTLVRVDAGGKTLRVVCGAHNFSPGDSVPVAMPGARLPGLGKLEARKIRGIASEGMLCSPLELGIGEDHSGILVLGPGAEVGRDVRDLLGLNETVLELEITPNRPDAMSLMGIAREVAACTGAGLKDVAFDVQEGRASIKGLVEVIVEDGHGCPRYLARVLEGVKVGPSPDLVRQRLSLAGIRPISNVVDATNYGMLVTGHPMHAFDLDLLKGPRIIVRRAATGERLTGIDGEDRALDGDDLVVADATGPVALAGLIGGLETSVTEKTTRIALESAYFDPPSIFRASKRHGLRTESSSRFERGADPNNVERAATVAVSLMLQWAGGELASGKVDLYPQPIEDRTVTMRPARAREVLGMDLDTPNMTDALERLGLKCRADGEAIRVTAPTSRRDLVAEEDLFEEIARVVGFDKIPATLPAGRSRAARPSPRRQTIQKIIAALTGAGLYEARTSILVGEADLQKASFSGPFLRITNPLTKDESILRPSLLPGLVAVLRRNFSRRNLDARFFETGGVFHAEGGPKETMRLAIALGGETTQEWYSGPRLLDFYDLKGAVETVLSALGIDEIELSDRAGAPFHPARSAEIRAGGAWIGAMGEMGKDQVKALDLSYPVQMAEFDLEALMGAARPLTPRPVQASRFPAVLLDIAVSVPEAVRAQDVQETARRAGGGTLERIRLIDVYTGEQAGAGRKSLAFSLIFRHSERTLTEEEALIARDAIAGALAKTHDGRIRQ